MGFVCGTGRSLGEGESRRGRSLGEGGGVNQGRGGPCVWDWEEPRRGGVKEREESRRGRRSLIEGGGKPGER